jgi:hypothetical protein
MYCCCRTIVWLLREDCRRGGPSGRHTLRGCTGCKRAGYQSHRSRVIRSVWRSRFETLQRTKAYLCEYLPSPFPSAGILSPLSKAECPRNMKSPKSEELARRKVPVRPPRNIEGTLPRNERFLLYDRLAWPPVLIYFLFSTIMLYNIDNHQKLDL